MRLLPVRLYLMNTRIRRWGYALRIGLQVSQSKGRPMLEVIGKGPASKSHPVPLLFVHGGYHAAWCWDENFLDYFADKGFRAVAVSLGGNCLSDLSKPLRSCSIADYRERCSRCR